jgi:hypothetical protein
MNNQVDQQKKSTNQLQPPKPEDIPVPEQANKTNWLQSVVQKIIGAVKWIKDVITFKSNTKIIAIKIDTNYIEPIEKKELSNIEFEEIVKKAHSIIKYGIL